MRRTKEAAAETREQLLNAALVCFRRQGYSVTTLDDIARQAGTTRGAIHWHFGNKVELFNTLVRERYERAAAIFSNAYKSAEESPLRQLRQLLIRWLSYVEEDEDFRAVLELLTLKTEIGPELAEGLQENVRGQRRSLAYFASLISKGIAAGEVRPEVEPDMAARAALGMMNGITSLWLMDTTAFSLKGIAQGTVDLFLESIRKR